MQRGPTPYVEINAVIAELQARIEQVFGDKLVGLYLHGSLVVGDFERERSDIDLVAALSSDVDEEEFVELQKMHADFVEAHKEWRDRIEISYIAAANLRTVRTRSCRLVHISPGEPLNRREAARHWLMHWYIVREKGLALRGPEARTLIEPIVREEFRAMAGENTRDWLEWIEEADRRGPMAYAILTLCRALYTVRHGEQASKRQAGLWAEKEFPGWAGLIQCARRWREKGPDDAPVDEEVLEEARRFVRFVIGVCEEEGETRPS